MSSSIVLTLAFYNCIGCYLNKKTSFNENRFKGPQNYLSRSMVNIKQPAMYLGRFSMDTAFERVHYLQVEIIRAKCNKWKEFVSLQSTNLAETYVVHIDVSKLRVTCSFCGGVFKSWSFRFTTPYLGQACEEKIKIYTILLRYYFVQQTLAEDDNKIKWYQYYLVESAESVAPWWMY